MDFQSITRLVLSLLGKRQELVSVVADAISLFNRVKGLWGTLPQQVTSAIEGAAAPANTMSIEWLQTSLNKLGATLQVDGKYGTGTQDAVRNFQAAHGLTPDGWAGIQTQAAIVSALG